MNEQRANEELDELLEWEKQQKLTNLQAKLMSTMTDVLGDYCKANNLAYLSADDILHTYPNLTDDQREWLTTFGKMWDKIQEL